MIGKIFKRKDDKGAQLIEFALLAPFLLLLLLGIVEFGFFLGQNNELKHGAHEGARLAAVDGTSLVAETCDSMTLHNNSTVNVTFTNTGSAIGSSGTVTLSATVNSLSGLGLIEVFLPNTITAEADFRIEQVANWSNPTNGSC